MKKAPEPQNPLRRWRYFNEIEGDKARYEREKLERRHPYLFSSPKVVQTVEGKKTFWQKLIDFIYKFIYDR